MLLHLAVLTHIRKSRNRWHGCVDVLSRQQYRGQRPIVSARGTIGLWPDFARCMPRKMASGFPNSTERTKSWADQGALLPFGIMNEGACQGAFDPVGRPANFSTLRHFHADAAGSVASNSGPHTSKGPIFAATRTAGRNRHRSLLAGEFWRAFVCLAIHV